MKKKEKEQIIIPGLGRNIEEVMDWVKKGRKKYPGIPDTAFATIA